MKSIPGYFDLFWGGNVVSGVNSGHAKHASLGWRSGGPPQNFLEKVSALRLILEGFGNQALTTVVIAPVPVNCL